MLIKLDYPNPQSVELEAAKTFASDYKTWRTRAPIRPERFTEPVRKSSTDCAAGLFMKWYAAPWAVRIRYLPIASVPELKFV